MHLLPHILATRRASFIRRFATWIPIIFALSVQACEDEKGPTAPANPETQSLGSTPEAGDSAGVLGTIPLPINQTFSGGLAFGITQTGPGRVGLFRISNASSASDALVASTNSSSMAAFKAITAGGGRAGHFLVNNATNRAPAIEARTEGLGPAGSFVNNNPDNIDAALRVFTRGGRGDALQASITGAHPNFDPAVGRFIVTVGGNGTGVDASNSGSGSAGVFRIQNGPNGFPALRATTIGPGWAGDFQGRSQGVRIQTDGGTGLSVLGGSKQAVVSTAAGARSLYSEEASEVWFADYGFGKLQDGRARVLIDPSFAQTVNLEAPYHVFVQPYGRAQLYVEERTNLGFVVRAKDGDPHSEFGYRVVAKRSGFEAERLEPAPWADSGPALEH